MFPKITMRGTSHSEFRYNGELTSTVVGLTVDNAAELLQGKAVTIDGSVDNGYTLSADNATIDGIILMAEYYPAEARVTISVETKGGVAAKLLNGNAGTKGTVAVGAGNGLVKTSGARTAQGPIIVEDAAKASEGLVVLLFK